MLVLQSCKKETTVERSEKILNQVQTIGELSTDDSALIAYLIANDTFINFVIQSYEVQQNILNTNLILSLSLDSITSDSMLFDIYGSNIVGNIANDFGMTDSVTFKNSMTIISDLAQSLDNAHQLSSKSSYFSTILYEAAFDAIINPTFSVYNPATTDASTAACNKALKSCYSTAAVNYWAAMAVAWVYGVTQGPVQYILAVSTAVANYEDDIDSCHDAWIDCIG